MLKWLATSRLKESCLWDHRDFIGLQHLTQWCGVLSVLFGVLTKIPIFNVCSCQKILRRNGRGQILDHWLNVPSLQTFLGRKIIRYCRSLMWKWEDCLIAALAHHSQQCARFVLLICYVADGYRRVDKWYHFLIPASRRGGWSLDYVCERNHFGRSHQN
jgi:hypothetical protein